MVNVEKKMFYDGNSLAIRIPKIMVDYLDLSEHSTVIIEDTEENGIKKIIVTKKIAQQIG